MTERITAPVRVRLSRAKGWRMPPNAVKVDRSTRWGNPFGVGPGCTRRQAVAAFALHLAATEQASLRDEIRSELRGKNLACWCPLDEPCHADVLLRLANEAST